MDSFLEALGALGVVFLILIGLLAGWLASLVAGGRNKLGYMAIGVLAALATPFLLAAVGVGLLAAGGLLVILAVAAVAAIIVLVIAKMIFD